MLIIFIDEKDNRRVARLKGIDWVDGEAYLHLSNGSTQVLSDNMKGIKELIAKGKDNTLKYTFGTGSNLEGKAITIPHGPNPEYIDGCGDLKKTDLTWRQVHYLIEDMYFAEETK